MVSKLGKYSIEKTDDGNLIVSGKSKVIKTVPIPEGDFIEIRSAWHVDHLPTKIVIELLDGSLEMFNLHPFKKIGFKDMTRYTYQHPRKLKAKPLPEILYQYYGLLHHKETMSETIKIRLKPSERDRLNMLAANAEVSVADYIRGCIQS